MTKYLKKLLNLAKPCDVPYHVIRLKARQISHSGEKTMKALTSVMEEDMLFLQLESSWHPDSETLQLEPPNPPV